MEATVKKKKSLFTTKEMVFTALFAVIIAVCSWISIPATVPFTLQTFAIFLALGMLGGKCGFFATLVYIILGAIGVPVFAGFKGGIGVLFGSTGGYILGFILGAGAYWLLTKFAGEKIVVKIIGMVLALLICYVFGTIWFMIVYNSQNEAVGLVTALGWCIFPFIVPDVIKMALAFGLSAKLSKYLKI